MRTVSARGERLADASARLLGVRVVGARDGQEVARRECLGVEFDGVVGLGADKRYVRTHWKRRGLGYTRGRDGVRTLIEIL